MPNFENILSSDEYVNPDAWKHQFLRPLIRKDSRDDFQERESSESNPNSYVVEIYPKPDPNHLEKSETYQEILKGHTISGFIDLRQNNKEKYTIWLGTDHMSLAVDAAKFPSDPNLSQYMIGIKVTGKYGNGEMHIIREMVGQSCNRTPEQIDKILNAVDVALKNTLL